MNREISIPFEEIAIHPVGVVKSGIKKPMLRADRDGLSLEERMDRARELHQELKEQESELVFAPEYEPALEGIEDFSHILVIYWPHLVPPERRKMRRTRPMGRQDMPEMGVFATCSPARPNSLLITAVRLLGREGNRLRVKGFEAVDGSPVLDVKPYNPGYYRVEDPVIPAWMEQLRREMGED